MPGMTGVGVPILDAQGRAVAALSIGTTTDRLTPDRKAIIVGTLRQEAAAIGRGVNPFNPTLRRVAAAMTVA
jgi:DNA-binding IclR family transcriptional regulator